MLLPTEVTTVEYLHMQRPGFEPNTEEKEKKTCYRDTTSQQLMVALIKNSSGKHCQGCKDM